jgi:hypothetical protein
VAKVPACAGHFDPQMAIQQKVGAGILRSLDYDWRLDLIRVWPPRYSTDIAAHRVTVTQPSINALFEMHAGFGDDRPKDCQFALQPRREFARCGRNDLHASRREAFPDVG